MSEKVYVAASFEQREETKEAHRLLMEAGHEITADWTTHREIAGLESEEERKALKIQYAIEDVEGVKQASTYILLLGERKSTGAHIEFGIALGAELKNILVVGKDDGKQLFYTHPSVKLLPSMNEVLELLSESY